MDFQHIPPGKHFVECTHPNRAAAEAFVLDKLIGVGEDPTEAGEAVPLAGCYTATDAHTYAVRVYPAIGLFVAVRTAGYFAPPRSSSTA
ncbi:hypothetical protein C6369_000630 [Rhodococcus rhodochrous]|uniref:hypothetical protein n=1 Tax=Rhodococcus rhodochrous TaxID=1829 RepID=UPI000D068E7A|nr:hypothetical protein [Rhodococcus rhodochrous]AYA23227.1 hypothetical protein C6369_000630 [Rhodococcus rhodochrous]